MEANGAVGSGDSRHPWYLGLSLLNLLPTVHLLVLPGDSDTGQILVGRVAATIYVILFASAAIVSRWWRQTDFSDDRQTYLLRAAAVPFMPWFIYAGTYLTVAVAAIALVVLLLGVFSSTPRRGYSRSGWARPGQWHGRPSRIGGTAIHYDDGGQLVRIGHQTVSYSPTGRILRIGDQAVSYAADGRISNIGGDQVAYGVDGRISSIGDKDAYYGT